MKALLALLLAAAPVACGRGDEKKKNDTDADATAIGTWTPIPPSDSVPHRRNHAAVALAGKVHFWGGQVGAAGQPATDVLVLDPASGAWSTTTPPRVNASCGRAFAVGATMAVGGCGGVSLYDPATSAWTRVDAPDLTSDALAAAGDQLVVETSDHAFTLFDPKTGTWRPLPTLAAATERQGWTLTWAGDRLVFWGGVESKGGGTYVLPTEGYSLKLDETAWKPMATAGAPEGRKDHVAVWTGARLFVWSGSRVLAPGSDGDVYRTTGGLYDPATDTWTPVTAAGAPKPRSEAFAAWTGDRVVVWGGGTLFESHADGALYDPATDAWTTVTTAGAPAPRADFAAAWTGSALVVWGGWQSVSHEGATPSYYADGGLFAP